MVWIPVFALVTICIIIMVFKKLKSMSDSLERIGTMKLNRTNIKDEILFRRHRDPLKSPHFIA